jgi:hypothetical protein
VCLWFHQIFSKKIIRLTNCPDCVPLISFYFALSISSLFLFHFYIHFHLYILTYTYSFNLQSHKRIKKLFTVRFVDNSSSFFLLLHVCWWGWFNWDFQILNWVNKIVNYFSDFGPIKKKKKYTRTCMNPSWSTLLPKVQRVDHSLCGLRILIFKPVHCGEGCGKHANPAQSSPHPPLAIPLT